MASRKKIMAEIKRRNELVSQSGQMTFLDIHKFNNPNTRTSHYTSSYRVTALPLKAEELRFLSMKRNR